jgi:DNA-directed RNA polymerase subunit RPC12/RpoP
MTDIKIIGEQGHEPGKARVICPWCKREMMADLAQYVIDMSKPARSKCPYCSGEIFTVMIIVSHKTLHQLGQSLHYIIQAVEEQVDPNNPDASKTILVGDGRKH